jgi:hypothetical protein
MKRFVLLILFILPILACEINNNDPLPTLAPTAGAAGTKVTPPAATLRPGTTAQPTLASTPRPGTTATPTLDRGDELDKLLDELNNALKNMDTLDDVK